MTETLHIEPEPGLWCQRVSPPAETPRAALFLDRDGVLLEEINYLHKVEDMRIIEGSAESIRLANELGIAVVIVTNQSGVGRGYYGWPEFGAVQTALLDVLDRKKAYVDMVLACAYHADAQEPYAVPDHPWRKPRPGMIHAAEKALSLNLSQSWIVGDSASDLEAARTAGLAGGLHVATGHGTRDRDKALALATDTFDVRAGDSVADAVPILKSYNG